MIYMWKIGVSNGAKCAIYMWAPLAHVCAITSKNSNTSLADDDDDENNDNDYNNDNWRSYDHFAIAYCKC